MAQSTATELVLQTKTCLNCPHFDNFHEPIDVVDSTAEDGRNAPAFGRGWCELFNHQVRSHHEITNDCINSSDSVISHELEDNLAHFPDVNFEELDVFPTEELEDELDKPHSEYQVGSVVKVIDKDEDYTEWAVFEVFECRFNRYIYDRNNPEAYLNHIDWYYRLASNNDGCTLGKSLWVREDEICHFDMAHNVCTEDVF